MKDILKSLQRREWFIRLTNWEYWSFNVVYGPLYLYWLLLVIRARSFFFFNTSNPRIRNGGFLMESKKEIYDLLPHGTYPVTLHFRAGTAWPDVWSVVSGTAGLHFPVIAKPDIGMRGMRVEVLQTEDELKVYTEKTEVDFLVQALADYPLEAGIFYFRYPGDAKGRISGIVGKQFLKVTGDGFSTVRDLMTADPRALLQLPALQMANPELLESILPANEERILVPYGNHARGSLFLDCSHEADDALQEMIDQLCRQIPEFYFGRLDIRFCSWEALRAGKQFSIIELNGAGSEPTHMYDPGHSLFFAWKEIIRHWNILFRISRYNHRHQKLPYMRFTDGIKMLRENNDYVKQISRPLVLQTSMQAVKPAVHPRSK